MPTLAQSRLWIFGLLTFGFGLFLSKKPPKNSKKSHIKEQPMNKIESFSNIISNQQLIPTKQENPVTSNP